MLVWLPVTPPKHVCGRVQVESEVLPLLFLYTAAQVDVLQQELKRLQQQLARQQRAADSALAAAKAEALSNRESLAGGVHM
jgi:hypothetical protein